MSDCRDLLDSLCESFGFEQHIGSHASPILNQDFENGLVAIQRGQFLNMSAKEAEECFHLRQRDAIDVPETTPNIFRAAVEIIQARKRRRITTCLRYSDIRYIKPTSNIVGRFFSKAKRAAKSRDRLSAIMFKMQLFLNENSKYWNKSTLNQVICSQSNKRVK